MNCQADEKKTSLYHPVKIGSLVVPGNIFLAPVAGYSDRAFRTVCIENGADMCYTEMVSAEALFRGSGKTENLLARAENEKIFAVQLFGGDEKSMYEATKIVLEKFKPSLIDINCGCPVPKIIKSGAGSALTRDPKRLFAIVGAASKACEDMAPEVPVTCKIRSGWDSEHLTWCEAAEAAIDSGAKAITIHARTRAQGYEGKADWEILGQLVQFVAQKNPGMPVFGSGDVFSPEDAARMLETTGCDGVMFARGAMGNPFIFGQTRSLLTSGNYGEISLKLKMKTAMQELRALVQDAGEDIACREMRKRFCCYTKGLQNGAPIRSKIVQASCVADYEKIASECLALES